MVGLDLTLLIANFSHLLDSIVHSSCHVALVLENAFPFSMPSGSVPAADFSTSFTALEMTAVWCHFDCGGAARVRRDGAQRRNLLCDAGQPAGHNPWIPDRRFRI